MPTTIRDLEHEEDQQRFAVEAHLRAAGWKHTSATPAGYWMWERELGGRVLLVDLKTAKRIQKHFEDEVAMGDDDEDEDDS